MRFHGGALLLALGLACGPTLAAPPRDRPAEAKAWLTALENEARPRFRSWPAQLGGFAARDRFQRLLAGAEAGDRSRLHWLIGQTDESLFDWPGALAAYTAAIGTARDPLERAAAQLGAARVQSFSAPASAEAILAGLADIPRAAAAVAQIRARMALTAGKPAQARAYLGEALAAIGRTTDIDSAAMLQSLTADLSLVAAFGGDTETAAAYGAASGLGSGRPFVPSFAPVAFCDAREGLLPEDAAVFEVSVYEGFPQRVVPVWSRRPAAAGAIAALGRTIMGWRWTDRPSPPVLQRGFRIEVACSPAGRWSFHGGITNAPWSAWDWLESKGILESPTLRQSPEKRSEIYLAALAAAEARYGIAAIELIPHLLRASEAGLGAAEARRGHLERAVAIMIANDAPKFLLAGLRMILLQRDDGANAAVAAEMSRQIPEIIAGLTPAERDGPFGIGIRYTLANAQETTGETTARVTGLRALLALPFARLPQADPLRRAVHYDLAMIEDAAGRHGEADRLRQAVGLPLDICDYAQAPVTALGVAINNESFPDILRREDIGGFVKVGRRVTADGSMAGTRIVYAQPPRLFDAASLAGFAGARNSEPRRGGKPFACTANPQSIFWRLKAWNDDQD